MKIIQFSLLFFVCATLKAQENRFLVQIGSCRLWMTPANDTGIEKFKLHVPGIQIKLSVETYVKSNRFVHMDLNMSFNHGKTKFGIVKSTRLVYNYGFGREFGRLKLCVNPGFTYVSLAYQDDRTGKTIADTRFAPSLGLQSDFAIINKNRQYVTLFIEFSAMMAIPSRMVNQISTGLSWKPVFSRPAKPMESPL